MTQATFSYKPRVSTIAITGTITHNGLAPMTDKQTQALLDEIVDAIGGFELTVGALILTVK